MNWSGVNGVKGFLIIGIVMLVLVSGCLGGGAQSESKSIPTNKLYANSKHVEYIENRGLTKQYGKEAVKIYVKLTPKFVNTRTFSSQDKFVWLSSGTGKGSSDVILSRDEDVYDSAVLYFSTVLDVPMTVTVVTFATADDQYVTFQITEDYKFLK